MLHEEIKTHAPLIAALDKHQDATGLFALWLESRGILHAYSRYGDPPRYPFNFYCDESRIDWQKMEEEFLTESKLIHAAKQYAEEPVESRYSIGAIAIEVLMWAPILFLLYLLLK
jgi:hypothetical protein